MFVIYVVSSSLCDVCCCVSHSICALVNCIFSNTYLTYVSSCIIFSLLFSSSSYSFTTWSYTFSMTNSTSSFAMMYSSTSSCAFIFFHSPLDCTIVTFSGLGCVGYVGIFPHACPSCVGMFSFLCVTPLVLSVRFFYYVTSLGIGLFFVSTLPPVGFMHLVVALLFVDGVPFLCDDPASVGCFYFVGYLSFGCSTITFHSSCHSFISHWTYSAMV
jgi:hypothetical protein